jgi:hypothetical protein
MSETYDRGTADAMRARRFPALKGSANVTLLLSRTELEGLLDPDACLDALRAGFLAAPGGVLPRRMRTGLPGLIDGVPAYTAKVDAKFPGGTGSATPQRGPGRSAGSDRLPSTGADHAGTPPGTSAAHHP